MTKIKGNPLYSGFLIAMNTIKALIAVIAALLAACLYAAGWWTAAQGYAKEKAEFEAQAQAQYAQALEAKAAREKYLQGKIEEAASNARKAQGDIETRYQMLLDAARRVPADVHFDGADAVGMHADAGGAGGQGNVSTASGAPGRVSASADKCAGSDGAKLRKLYEEQLSIARDCDITAAHYNELIRLYDEASRQ